MGTVEEVVEAKHAKLSNHFNGGIATLSAQNGVHEAFQVRLE
jgi:hypothetical protein